MYVVLQVAGLTIVALTVMGGTGLLGIIPGIAFRDITGEPFGQHLSEQAESISKR